ncbi:uncharacterized protein LOC111385628, partial [Olea europaea var. sylvestris]|uniref:uncharacterized protein LOC111385628 n=1 Tax=Olea europaea var. sylvestris TaxID=158386 RepID=UPI000C1D6A53
MQMGKFINCLIEARNELKNKSEVVKRKFIITKALLFKADRSSANRLHDQVYKLEVEHKRLEDDAFVYNWLEQQLKLSPAYEKNIIRILLGTLCLSSMTVLMCSFSKMLEL